MNEKDWIVRKTKEEELSQLQAIFDFGREQQIKSGNHEQWALGYPGREIIRADFEKDSSYVLLDQKNDTILATMALIPGADPTYSYIESGEWLNENDYVTIHRIANAGLAKGTGQYLISWAKEHFNNIRIDTHKDNQPMIHVIGKLGFEYCGIIYVENGDPRNAYQYLKGR